MSAEDTGGSTEGREPDMRGVESEKDRSVAGVAIARGRMPDLPARVAALHAERSISMVNFATALSIEPTRHIMRFGLVLIPRLSNRIWRHIHAAEHRRRIATRQ